MNVPRLTGLGALLLVGVACRPGDPRLDCVAGCEEAMGLVAWTSVYVQEGTAAAFQVTEGGEPFEVRPRHLVLSSDDPEILGVGPTRDDTFVLYGVSSGLTGLRLEVGSFVQRFDGNVLPR